MKFKTAVELIRMYTCFVEYSTIAKALGITTQAVQKRIERESDLKYEETFILAKAFHLPVRLFFNAKDLPVTIPIDYWDSGKIRLERNPNIPQYHMNFELAYKYNRNFSKNDFRIICMRGDKLDGGQMWCRDKDLLLLDITRNDVNIPGLYAYECDGGEYVAMAYIEKKPDGALFSYSNSDCKPEFRDDEFLKRVKFKVIGAIIKNLFYFM